MCMHYYIVIGLHYTVQQDTACIYILPDSPFLLHESGSGCLGYNYATMHVKSSFQKCHYHHQLITHAGSWLTTICSSQDMDRHSKSHEIKQQKRSVFVAMVIGLRVVLTFHSLDDLVHFILWMNSQWTSFLNNKPSQDQFCNVTHYAGLRSNFV